MTSPDMVESISRNSDLSSRAISALGSVALLAALWSLLRLFGTVDEVLPSVVDIVSAAPGFEDRFSTDHSFWVHALVSLGRLLAGWGGGVALGAALGWLIGANEIVHRVAAPVVEFSKFIVPTVLLPVLFLGFGIGETRIIVLTGLVPFWLAAGAVGNFRRQRAERMAATPTMAVNNLVTVARISLVVAVILLAGAESTTGNAGLGNVGMAAATFMFTEIIYLAYFMLALIAFGLDLAIRSIGAAVIRRMEEVT